MDIYEALEKLDGFFDMLANQGVYSDEELELMGQIEDTIYKFARKYEPQKSLPLEWECTCGAHLFQHAVVAGMSQFKCPDCGAEWLIGPQEV